MTCPTCGCQIHHAPQTWTVRCSVCRHPKYPYTVEKPMKSWVCQLCQIDNPRRAAVRQRALKRKAATTISGDKRG